MSKFPMTVQGARALEGEVKHLGDVPHPRINQTIAKARELDDLKENAGYHAAREQQDMVEVCIHDTEAKPSNAQVIDVTAIPHSGKVIFGTIAGITNVETDETVIYRIVSGDEVDIKGGKISVSLPVAHILIGKAEGDIVLVRVPGGDVEYKIVEVRHI